MPDRLEPALAGRFSVKLGSLPLGVFTGCTGLDASYDTEEWTEGGNDGYVHRLPVRVRYGDVSLTRPVDMDSGVLAAWFSAHQRQFSRGTASIVAFDANSRPVARWDLEGVWPVHYSGPQLSSAGTAVAVETLVLAHNGFTIAVPA